jgi:hypothetical protein
MRRQFWTYCAAVLQAEFPAKNHAPDERENSAPNVTGIPQ